MLYRFWSGLAVATLLLTAGPAAGQVFYPDDPVRVAPDRIDTPKPATRELSDYYDYYENAVGAPGRREGSAMNINTLDEVPVSSWYQPRHYYDRMALDSLRRGPLRGNRPDPDTPWTVVGGKSEGKSAGLTIVDGEGDRYLLKFDSPGHIELSTGAEAIATRIFYALGYHVPENYLVEFSRDQLEPGPDATYETKTGNEAPITSDTIDQLLRNAAQYPDGSYRALASLFLSGEPLGPFQYYGTRPDDPNDIFPHEMRRELRGLRVAAAWLNHDDSRSINSLDMYVEDEGRQFVRHYLIDFGTTFGGGPLGPKEPWVGRERIVEPGTILSSAVTLGFVGRPWTRAQMPDIPAIGHFRTDHFDPEAWRPQYRNPAFANTDADDAFWMAKQIVHFTNEELRALVETGRYSDPRTTEYLTEALIVRRNKIADAYLDHGGGLDRFAVEDEQLVFADLRARHAEHTNQSVTRRYSVRWFGFNNATGRRTDTLGTATVRASTVSLPSSPAPYIVAALSRPSRPGTTEVYLRREGDTRAVVGVRRHAEGLPNTVPEWTVVPEPWASTSPSSPDTPPASRVSN